MPLVLNHSEHIPGPAYSIRTRRLIIRCWNPTDASLLKTAIEESVEHLRPWMPWAHNEPEEFQRKIERIRLWRSQFDAGRDFVYGIFNQDESRVLGGTGLHTRAGEGAREIGYWIHKDYLNVGLATEVACALTRVAFEIDHVKRIEIHCQPENVRSAAIPRKLGYSYEGTLHKRAPFLDRMVDSMIWTLFAEDYPKTPCASAELEAFDVIGRRIL